MPLDPNCTWTPASRALCPQLNPRPTSLNPFSPILSRPGLGSPSEILEAEPLNFPRTQGSVSVNSLRLALQTHTLPAPECPQLSSLVCQGLPKTELIPPPPNTHSSWEPRLWVPSRPILPGPRMPNPTRRKRKKRGGVVPPHHHDPPASVSGGNILHIPEGGEQRRKSRFRISDQHRMGRI